MSKPIFPAAAAPADQPHPRNCACLACIDALIAEMDRPLVLPAPRTDPAAWAEVDLDPAAGARDAWAAVVPEANRATRGPGTGGGAGRRPSGPGRRRTPGTPGGEGRPGGCALTVVALVAYLLLLAAVASAAVWVLLAYTR